MLATATAEDTMPPPGPPAPDREAAAPLAVFARNHTRDDVLRMILANCLAVAIHRGHRSDRDRAGQDTPSWATRPAPPRDMALESGIYATSRSLDQARADLANTVDGPTWHLRARITRLENGLHALEIHRPHLQRLHRTPARKPDGAWIIRVPALTGYTADGPLDEPERTLHVTIAPNDWDALREWRHGRTTPRGRDEITRRLEGYAGLDPEVRRQLAEVQQAARSTARVPTPARALYEIRPDGGIRELGEPEHRQAFDRIIGTIERASVAES